MSRFGVANRRVTGRNAYRVFAATYGKLVLARPGEASVTTPISTSSDEAFAAGGRELRAALVLGFRVTKSDVGAAEIAVRLIRSADGSVVWSADYPLAGSDAAGVGEKVAEAVVAKLP